jgi:hypothetical protein
VLLFETHFLSVAVEEPVRLAQLVIDPAVQVLHDWLSLFQVSVENSPVAFRHLHIQVPVVDDLIRFGDSGFEKFRNVHNLVSLLPNYRLFPAE